MELFKAVQDFICPNPMAPRSWSGDPLVIVDFDEEIVFAGKAMIEATRLDEKKFNLRTTDFEPELQLNDATLIPTTENLLSFGMQPYSIRTGNRAGDIFEGVDQDGEPATWYLGRSADTVLLEKSK